MRTNLIRLFLVAGLATGSSLFADTVSGVTNIDNTNDGNHDVGPYKGTFDGTLTTIYCDDVAHTIDSGTHTVNVETIFNLTGARFAGVSGATALYEEAFYLSTLLGTYTAPAPASTRIAVQDAIWYLFDNSYTTGGGASNTYVTQAQQNYAGYSYANFKIITPTDGSQELFVNSGSMTLVKTPEPTSLALIFLGLSLLAYNYKRKMRIARIKRALEARMLEA